MLCRCNMYIVYNTYYGYICTKILRTTKIAHFLMFGVDMIIIHPFVYMAHTRDNDNEMDNTCARGCRRH